MRGLAGDENIRRAGREVDHGRYTARRHQAQNRHHRAVRIRQHDADGAPLGGQRHELGPEDGSADEKALIGVFDRDAAAAVRFGGLHHRFDHRAVGRGGAEHEIGHDAVERRARGLPALAALELGVDGELHGLENRDRHLGKPAPAHLTLLEPAERGLLQAFDAYGHDLGIGLVRDQGRTVIDLHQAAGDGDAPFRKDDQRIARLHLSDQGAHRHRLERIERHRLGQLHERPHPPQLRDPDVDGEDRLAVAQRQRETRVEEAHMVEGDDQIGAGIVEIVDAFHFHPEQGAIDDRERIAERACRHGAADGDRDQEARHTEQ